MLVRACNRSHTCKYYDKISQLGPITNLHNYTFYSFTIYGTWQSDNLIYCLVYNLYNIKHVGQTKNTNIDRFQGNIFYMKHMSNKTVLRYFASQITDPRMTIHILENINFPRNIPRSNSILDQRELIWIIRVNTIIPNDLNILD